MGIEEGDERGELDRKRRGAKDHSEDPQAETGGVGHERAECSPDRLDVAWVLRPVQRKRHIRHVVGALRLFDRLDEGLDGSTTLVEVDHHPAGNGIELRPPDAGRRLEDLLNLLDQGIPVLVFDRTHLDMGSSLAPPDTSPTASRAASQRPGEPHHTCGDALRGPLWRAQRGQPSGHPDITVRRPTQPRSFRPVSGHHARPVLVGPRSASS